MIRLLTTLGFVTTLVSGLWIGADAAPRSVNITSDSATGWIPSIEQEAAALSALNTFLGAYDGGQGHAAYQYLSLNNREQSEPAFIKAESEFNALSGPLKSRVLIKTTWTKNPRGPTPGIYAAIDIVSAYANIDRHCGYIVMYQSPAGGDFTVTRRQDVYMSNAVADSIAAKGSKAGIDGAWLKASASCPNYPQSELLRVSAERTDGPLPETGSARTGSSVSATLATLKSRRDIEFRVENGWIIATDEKAMTIWSFAPQADPAYPAVVRRKVVPEGSGAKVEMNVNCEATKVACDKLVRVFSMMLNASGAR